MNNGKTGRLSCRDGVCITDGVPYIEVDNLGVRYGNHIAFEHVTAAFSPCSITALIGPSGCGKSSFLSCFNRLTDLIPGCRVEGNIRIGGRSVFEKGLDLRQLRTRIGMVFQKPNPFPLSIWKNLALPLREHGLRDARELEAAIVKALSDVGLWDEVKDRLKSSALTLSGGQQQRLCIARALALKPEMILFDEPCSALDPMASEKVEELIRSLRSQLNVMIVTHNLAQARRISDEVAIFWVREGRGRLIEFGKTKRVFANPREVEVQAYLSGQVG